jgi:aspartate/methionine/tyrosine aminotransferase
VAAPVQRAAIVAYQGLPEIEQHIAVCAGIHGLRTKFLWEGLRVLGIRCPEPQGAFYVMPDFDQWRAELAGLGIQDSNDLSHYLLEEHEIATLPGSVFGLPPEALALRLSSSYIDMETEAQAERLLSAHQSGIDPGEFMSAEHHPNLHACLNAFSDFIRSLPP